jgi:hypothetical protein
MSQERKSGGPAQFLQIQGLLFPRKLELREREAEKMVKEAKVPMSPSKACRQ